MTAMDPTVATVTSAQATAVFAALECVAHQTTIWAMQGPAKLEQQEVAYITVGNVVWRDNAATVACTKRRASKVGIIANNSALWANQAAQKTDGVHDFRTFHEYAQRPKLRASTMIGAISVARQQRVLAGDPSAPVWCHIENPELQSKLIWAATLTRERRA